MNVGAMKDYREEVVYYESFMLRLKRELKTTSVYVPLIFFFVLTRFLGGGCKPGPRRRKSRKENVRGVHATFNAACVHSSCVVAEQDCRMSGVLVAVLYAVSLGLCCALCKFCIYGTLDGKKRDARPRVPGAAIFW